MITKFLNYVEIRTKITSTFAFLYTCAVLVYWDAPVKWGISLLFFVSMFLFDLATTAINNYIDSKDGTTKLQFSRNAALLIIYVLFGISVTLGLVLVWQTDIIVFFLGGLCFLCGVLYTYGPIPISRQPLGEIFSGIFYGFFIPFLMLYINMPMGTYLTLKWNFQTINLELQIFPLFAAVLLAVIPTCATANIMLANNICDLEQDILVKRHTLPYYLGKRKAVYLFALIYYAVYPAVILMVILKILSPICLASLVSLIPVQKNIKTFFGEQNKAKTFVVSIQNYVILMGTNTALILISGLVN